LQKLGWEENELRKDDPHILQFKIIRIFSMAQLFDLKRYNSYLSDQELHIKRALREV